MRPHDMKYICFTHQRENKQNSDKTVILLKVALTTVTLNPEYNDWIIRVIKHTEIITSHIISVKLPYTKGAPYPIVLVFWISYRGQGELKIVSLRLEANIQ